MDSMVLPSELERFAEEAVATGRYPNMAAVVVAGVELLQHQEQVRKAFIASLENAESEAEREGWHNLDAILTEAEQIIVVKHNAA